MYKSDSAAKSRRTFGIDRYGGFSASDLSSYLTGEVIYLDGGASLTSAGQFNFLPNCRASE
jgi:enoyl-[acyl-carrier-protein] reductase (NADH)